jgi:hypothetical protein
MSIPNYKGPATVNADQIRLAVESMGDYVRRSLTKSISGRTPYEPKSKVNPMAIDRVIFNNPATIVIWADGTKTVVKCQEGDVYSKETGLALCIAKKALGNKGNFNGIFHKWIPEEAVESEVSEPQVKDGEISEAVEGCMQCRLATRTDEPFTVYTPSGRKVMAQFNHCPVCGKEIPKKKVTPDA